MPAASPEAAVRTPAASRARSTRARRGATLSWRWLREARVHGCDELGRRDEAVVIEVLGVVVERRASGLDLPERHAALDHVGDAVAHDDDHVPELDDVGLVADSAVTGDHVGAAFLRLGR